MWFNARPNLTLLCGWTQNQMLQFYVCQPITKWYTLMWYPLYRSTTTEVRMTQVWLIDQKFVILGKILGERGKFVGFPILLILDFWPSNVWSKKYKLKDFCRNKFHYQRIPLAVHFMVSAGYPWLPWHNYFMVLIYHGLPRLNNNSQPVKSN